MPSEQESPDAIRLRHCIALLDSGYDEGRASGLLHLLNWGPDSVPAILQVLQTPYENRVGGLPRSRLGLVNALGLLGDKRALPVLEQLLVQSRDESRSRDDDQTLKEAIARLAGPKPSKAVALVDTRDLLDAGDEKMVLEGIRRFQAEPSPALQTRVDKLAHDKRADGEFRNPRIREAAVTALWNARLFEPRAEDVPILVRLAAADKRAFDAVIKLGAEGLPHVLREVQSDDERVAETALKIVNRLKPPRSR